MFKIKKNAEKKDLPVSSIIVNSLYRTVALDQQLKVLPSVTITQNFLRFNLMQMNEIDMEELAKEAPKLIQKMFTFLGLEYITKNVLEEFFSVIGKTWEWYEFSFDENNDRYRLVFETKLGKKWATFLGFFIKNILNSLKIYSFDEEVTEGVLVYVFKLQTKTEILFNESQTSILE
ncbi:MAG: hypothetical protein OEL77_02835 [Nitrosopumilus sp.]|nr:hypothetical protein [Nitrosopumilus sp.]MDH3384930.1 hypothetical protein [Nitrosopumilus sp.]